MRFTTRTHPSRPGCSSLRDTHVGSNANNGTQCELTYLNANNAPGNRNRNIGGHGMLFKKLVSPSLGHCEQLNTNLTNSLVGLSTEELEIRA